MNKKEITMTLAKVKSMYPNQFKGIKAAEWQIIGTTWQTIIGGYSYQETDAALNAYISTGKEWAPNPGQIKKIIDDSKNPTLAPYDAWQMVRKALSNAGGRAESEFKKLPGQVQATVGSPAILRQWAMTDLNEVENYIKPRFIKEFQDRADVVKAPELKQLEGSDIVKKLSDKMAL